MKKLIFILSVLVISNNLYSWDTTAAKFYPLAVGNLWSYRHVNYSFLSCIPAGFYDYLVRIDSMVLRPNGKRYYKFSNGNLARVDSTTMNVYRYIGNNECMTDSLLARKNDTVRACYYVPGPVVVTDTAHVFFANMDRRKLRMQQMIIGVFYHELVEGLGLYYHINCEGGGSHESLNGCIINGIQYGTILGTIGINNISSEVPEHFSLSQNYPNPFNPTTKIRFSLPLSSKGGVHDVKLVVYDVLGKEVASLIPPLWGGKEGLSPGTYEVDFDGSNLPSGVYYYTITVRHGGSSTMDFNETKRMVLIK